MKLSVPSTIPQNYAIAYSTPTVDLKDSGAIKKYLLSSSTASYQVIPGVLDTFAVNPFAIVSDILPETENMLLDLTLPYIQDTGKKLSPPVRHLARYMIFNRKLIGIRVNTTQNWERFKYDYIDIPHEIKTAYDKMGVSYVNSAKNTQQDKTDKILIGDFFVKCANFKIAPIFQSEISFLDGSNTKKILAEYYDMGCQVFSVVNNLTEKRKQHLIKYFFIRLFSPINVLKKHRRDSTMTVYCGSQILTDIFGKTTYKTNSFACQSNQYSNIVVTNYDRPETKLFVVDFSKIKQNRQFRREKQSPLLELLDCEKAAEIGKGSKNTTGVISMQKSVRGIKKSFLNPALINKFGEIMQTQPQSYTAEKRKQLYLWYLFNNVNKGTQFILSYPLDQTSEILLHLIESLCKDLLVDIKSCKMVKLLSVQKAIKKHTVQVGDKLYPLLKDLSEDRSTNYYLYFDIEKYPLVKGYLSEHDNVYNSFDSLPSSFFDKQNSYQDLQEPNSESQLQQSNEENIKFIERFLKKKTHSLELFYSEALSYYTRHKLDAKLTQKLYKELRRQVRLSIKPTPFYNFVAQKSFEQALEDIIRLQSRTTNSFRNNVKGQQTENNEGDHQNSFRSFIQKVRHYSASQIKNTYPCHCCGAAFRKADKDYVKKCAVCKLYICISCYDQKTGRTAQNQQMLPKCLVCSRVCDCSACKLKFNMAKRTTQGSLAVNNDISGGSILSSSSFTNNSNNLGLKKEFNQLHNNERIVTKEINNNYQSKQNQQEQQFLMKQQKRPQCDNTKMDEEPLSTTEHKNTNKANIKGEQVSSRSQPNLPLAFTQQIKTCETCVILQRNDRNIDFQCSKCLKISCLNCQKAGASMGQLNWGRQQRWGSLRGGLICNECFREEKQKQRIQTHYKDLAMRFQMQKNQQRQQKYMKYAYNANLHLQSANTMIGVGQAIEQQNENDQQQNSRGKQLRFAQSPQRQQTRQANVRGGSTPLFGGIKDHGHGGYHGRYGNQNFSSPVPSENSSMASFGAGERKAAVSGSNKSGHYQHINNQRQSKQKSKHRSRSRSRSGSSKSSSKNRQQRKKKFNLNSSGSLSNINSNANDANNPNYYKAQPQVPRDNNNDSQSISSSRESRKIATIKPQKSFAANDGSPCGSVQSGQFVVTVLHGNDQPGQAVQYRNGNKWGPRQDTHRGRDYGSAGWNKDRDTSSQEKKNVYWDNGSNWNNDKGNYDRERGGFRGRDNNWDNSRDSRDSNRVSGGWNRDDSWERGGRGGYRGGRGGDRDKGNWRGGRGGNGYHDNNNGRGGNNNFRGNNSSHNNRNSPHNDQSRQSNYSTHSSNKDGTLLPVNPSQTDLEPIDEY